MPQAATQASEGWWPQAVAGHVAIGIVAEAEWAGGSDGVRVGGAVTIGAHAGLADEVAQQVILIDLVAYRRRGLVVDNGQRGRVGCAQCGVGRAAEGQINGLARLCRRVVEDRHADGSGADARREGQRAACSGVIAARRGAAGTLCMRT